MIRFSWEDAAKLAWEAAQPSDPDSLLEAVVKPCHAAYQDVGHAADLAIIAFDHTTTNGEI